MAAAAADAADAANAGGPVVGEVLIGVDALLLKGGVTS